MKKLLLLLFMITAQRAMAVNGLTFLPSLPPSSSLIKALEVDAQGNIYCGNVGGLMMYSNSNWINFNISNSTILSNNLKSLYSYSNNELLIGFDNGFSVFNGANFTNFSNSVTGIPSTNITCLAKNNNGFWLGTNSGLYNYNGSTLTSYNISNGNLNNDTVLNIKTLNNTVWVVTKNGLTKIDNGISTTFLTANANLHTTKIKDIGVYDNKLWLVFQSYDITYHINVQYFNGQTFEYFDDGLFHDKIDDYVNFTKMCTTPNGLIFFSDRFSFTYFEFNEKRIYNLSQFPVAQNNAHFKWLPTANNTLIHYFLANNAIAVVDLDNYDSFGQNGLMRNNKFNDINEVRALVTNRGDMHWDQTLEVARCEFPKGTGKQSNFSQALWLGGIDNAGNLHTAAQTYRQIGCDFWPGPLDTVTASIDTLQSIRYDKIWKINRFDIEEFKWAFQNGTVQNGMYKPLFDIIDWPANGGDNFSRKLAPFVDVNADGIYNPLGDGDYPKIKGDQMLFWIFNDKLTSHGETGGLPIGVEIHASAYAFTCDNLLDSLKVVNKTIFYEYDIINRSNINYQDFYVGNWRDPDIGVYYDDFVACNIPLNLSYCYNSDEQDGSGSGNSYGAYPPLTGNTILRGSKAIPNDGIDNNNNGIIDEVNEENLMMHNLNFRNDQSQQGNPMFPAQFFNYLKSIWKDNTPLTTGNSGYGGTTPTSYSFDGSPWDTATWNCNEAADWRSVQSSGPSNFAAGDTIHFAYAFVNKIDSVNTYGTQNYYESFFNDVNTIRQLYYMDSIPSCLAMNLGLKDEITNPELITIFPNPSSNFINIKSLNYPIDNIQVYNLQGALIKTQSPNSKSTSINIENLSDGIYVIKVQNLKQTKNFKVIKARE